MVMLRYRHPQLSALEQHSSPGAEMLHDVSSGGHAYLVPPRNPHATKPVLMVTMMGLHIRLTERTNQLSERPPDRK